MLQRILPRTHWCAIGVIRHRNVAKHLDQTRDLSIAITLTGKARLCTTSPLTGNEIELNLSDFTAFHAGVKHAVRAENEALTLACYTPRRPLPGSTIEKLKEAFFPVRDNPEARPQLWQASRTDKPKPPTISMGQQLKLLQQAAPQFEHAQHKAMLAASQQLKQLTTKPVTRETLALKHSVQAEAKRLHVQPALGVDASQATDKPPNEQDKDGFQQLNRCWPSARSSSLCCQLR
eukprot:3692721-Amphidinium_carterae.1